MKITVIARADSVDEELKMTAEKKVAKLERFFGADGAAATVTFREIRNEKIAEITISLGGTYFRAEESAQTFRNALDQALSTMTRQIRRNKTRLEKRFKGNGLAMEFLPDENEYFDDPEDENEEFEIRTKTFTIKPMSPEEAILQMNLLDHNFFVFSDAQTLKTCVVYKRHDNTYGLIMPQ